MKTKVLVLFVVAVMLFISACSKDDSSYTYPLKVGNSWTYERTVYSKDDQFPPFVGIIEALIDSIVIAPSGQECYRLRFEEFDEDNDPYVSYQYLANLPEGLCSLGGDGRGAMQLKGYRAMTPIFSGGKKASKDDDSSWFKNPHLLIPKTPKVGATWIQPEDDHWINVRYFIEEPETVVTDIGTFKCHVKRSHVRWDSKFLEYQLFDYYSPKGLAKFLVVGLSDQDDERQEEIWEEIRLIACDLK